MMNNRLPILIAVFILFMSPSLLSAQSKIMFRIDLSKQIKDSTFIPNEYTVELTGNQLPFSKTRTIELENLSPSDSIYTGTVNFPSLTNGKVLKYNYLIRDGNRDINVTERRPRLLPLEGQERRLPVTYLNSYYQ